MRLVWVPLSLLLLLAATWVLQDCYSPSRRRTARRRLEELPLLEIVTRDRQDEDKLPFLQKVAFKQTWDRFKFTLMDSEITADEKEDPAKSMRTKKGYPVRASPFKLQNCQSDCDTDKDCDQGLYCYQRERNSDPIPGCTFVTPEGSEDFCVAMPIPLSIVRPNHPVPSPSKPTRRPSIAPSTTEPTVTPTDIPTVSPSTTLPTSTSPTWTPTTTPSATNAPSTACPSNAPTAAIGSPSTHPSFSRVRTTLVPTAPTENPSMMPTIIPTTDLPSAHPTKDLTSFPSRSPSSFIVPTTAVPTTDSPSTTNPSMMPVQTTELPSGTPSTSPPSGLPTTSSPSTSPSSFEVGDTTVPTTTVTPYDTSSPTTSPTTSAPSKLPTTSTQQPEGPVLPDAQYVGNNGSPLEAFPLQVCQGDCDSDSDCSDGLVCYLRQDENEAIPGCLKRKHGGPAGTDFCVSLAGLLTSAPSTAQPSRSLTNAPSTARPSSSPSWKYVQPTWPPSAAPSTSPPSSFPTASSPSTSPSTLVMVETPAPSSSPTTSLPTERPTTSTQQPTEPSFPVAEYVGNDGSPSGAYPLQICQGDCDYDRDCSDGLVCYQRQEEEDPIPGCLNTGGQGGTDFCVLPIAPTALPTTHPSASPSPRPTTFSASTQPPTETEPALPDAEYAGNDGSPSKAYPLQACQGDCDSDSDCSGGLLCYEREDENDPIPGCQNTAHGGPAGTDFCIPPAAPISNDGLPAATIVGNGDFDESNYPLKMCQGDCDEDWDCEFPLICYQRSRSSDPIPGCSFDRGLVKTSDFCVPSQADDGSNKILEGAFRLRLYWEEGYVWQESTIESFWCASMNYNKDRCWYGRIGKRCRSDHMYLTRCGGTSVKPEDQAFIFVPFDDDQVLIQSANREDLRCWERSRRELLLRTCDPNNPLQRWIATDGTSFFDPDDNRFEISQIGYEKQCVSNDHHPKEAEAVELHSCIYNKDPESQTAYWERF